MNKYSIRISLLILFLLLSTRLHASEFNGPLLVKNRFPLFLHLNMPGLESAVLEDSFSAGLSHSTIYVYDTSRDWDVYLDMEYTELDFRIRKVVPGSVELGAELLFISFNSGFMDSSVNDFHRIFNFPDYGREERPDNDFLYEVKKNGATVVKGELGKAGISDIRLSAKKALMLSDPAVSLKLGLELPSGDAENGYGSGETGIDMTLMLDKRLGDSLMTYVNAGMAFPGDLDGYERVETRPFRYGSFGIEAIPFTRIAVLAQLSIQESPFPDMGISSIDSDSAVLAVGGRYSAAVGNFELGFMEDLNTSGAPDFTVNLSYKVIY